MILLFSIGLSDKGPCGALIGDEAGPLVQSHPGLWRPVAAHLPGQEPVRQRIVGQHAKAKMPSGGHHLCLGVSLEQRPLVLR